MGRYQYDKENDSLKLIAGKQPDNVYRYNDALSLEEIESNDNLDGKISDAEAIKTLNQIKINYDDALSLEEIEASTDLNNKVAGANAVKVLKNSLTQTDNKISSLLITSRLSKTISVSGSPTGISFSENKSGYKPIMYNLYHSYSTGVNAGFESVTLSNGSFSASGFAANTGSGTLNVPFTVFVLWQKI